MGDQLFALSDATLHLVKGAGQRAQFVTTIQLDWRLVIAAPDPLGRPGQRIDRLGQAARQQQRSKQRGDQPDKGDQQNS